MKHATQALSLAVLLAACAKAQTVTIVNNPADTGVVTKTYSICPTGTSSTITLSTTVTLCPGPQCAGNTQAPMPMTTTGPDGKTTVYQAYPYTAPCPCAGGVCDAVYTLTRPCPCTGPMPAPTTVPAGFTTSAMVCHECAMNGGPSTVMVTTPMTDGPYASQTPVMGAPHNGVFASAGASAYASAGPNGAMANGGSNAVAAAGNGYAAANADSGASASTWSNSTNSASSHSDSNAQAGDGMVGPMSNTPTIKPWTGSADRAVYAMSAVAASVIGCMALML